MTIAGKSLLQIDKLFLLPHRLLDLIPHSTFKNQSTADNPVLVIKFMGIGSITRWVSLCEEHHVDLRRVILLTFSRHRELCELFGIKCWYIRTGSLFEFIGDCWNVMRQTKKLRPSWIVDYERCSHSVSVFRKLLIWHGRSRSIAFESRRKKSWPGEMIHSSEELTFSQLMTTGIEVMPKIQRPVTEGVAIQVLRQKVIVNVNASDYLLARRYSSDSFIDLVRTLHQRDQGLVFYFTGSENEHGYVEKVLGKLSDVKAVNTCGLWSFEHLINELSACSVFITGDSGPLHIAAYLGVPVIALWGPTQPDHFGYADHLSLHHLTLRLTCSPCFKHPASRPALNCNGTITCLRDLSAKTVMEKTMKVIDTTIEYRQVHFPPGMLVQPARVRTTLAS